MSTPVNVNALIQKRRLMHEEFKRQLMCTDSQVGRNHPATADSSPIIDKRIGFCGSTTSYSARTSQRGVSLYPSMGSQLDQYHLLAQGSMHPSLPPTSIKLSDGSLAPGWKSNWQFLVAKMPSESVEVFGLSKSC